MSSVFDAPAPGVGVRTLLDRSLLQQGEVCNFNCGLKTRSMQVKVADYVAAEAPEIVDISSEP